jgi:hypothetical protein
MSKVAIFLLLTLIGAAGVLVFVVPTAVLQSIADRDLTWKSQVGTTDVLYEYFGYSFDRSTTSVLPVDPTQLRECVRPFRPETASDRCPDIPTGSLLEVWAEDQDAARCSPITPGPVEVSGNLLTGQRVVKNRYLLPRYEVRSTTVAAYLRGYLALPGAERSNRLWRPGPELLQATVEDVKETDCGVFVVLDVTRITPSS